MQQAEKALSIWSPCNRQLDTIMLFLSLRVGLVELTDVFFLDECLYPGVHGCLAGGRERLPHKNTLTAYQRLTDRRRFRAKSR